MTLQQEAYNRIDQMTDEGIKVLIDIIDKMRTVSVTGFKDVTDIPLTETKKDQSISKADKKKRFLQSAGKIKVDEKAINELRERSMI